MCYEFPLNNGKGKHKYWKLQTLCKKKLGFALRMDIYARNVMRYRYFCYKSMNQ